MLFQLPPNMKADTERLASFCAVLPDELRRRAAFEFRHDSWFGDEVYDVLRALTNAGLIRRIQPAGSVARYEARVGDNHHHVVCRLCGAIADVDCAVGYTPCLTAADGAGYQIGEAEVTYWGRCPQCAAAASAAPTG